MSPTKNAHRKGGDANTDRVGSGGELHQQAGDKHPVLTTNQGLAISDNQNSLRAHARGPTLARGLHPAREDHPLRP